MTKDTRGPIEGIGAALMGLMEIVHQICPPALQEDIAALMDEWAGEE